MVVRYLLQHTARRQINVFSPVEVTLPLRAFSVLVGVYLEVSLLALDVLALLLQLHHKLFIHFHLSPSLVLWISGLLHELLVDVVLDVEPRSGPPDSVLVSGSRGIVGTALEEGHDRVNHKEDDEDVVEVESSLLTLGLGSKVVKLVTTSRKVYALKLPRPRL